MEHFFEGTDKKCHITVADGIRYILYRKLRILEVIAGVLHTDLLQSLYDSGIHMRLENSAQIGSADKKVAGNIFHTGRAVVFVHIGKDLRDIVNTGGRIFGKTDGVGMIALQVSKEQSEHKLCDFLAVIFVFAKLQHHVKN